ncbi:hypothetical protein ACFLXT_00975 [Chloroflexota bacterium]
MMYLMKLGSHKGQVDVLIGIIVFGSIWGFLEATLGGLFHFIHFPYKGAIMGGIAISIMATFITMQKRNPGYVICLGFIAALFKPLDALILGAPLFAPFVINPAIAILSETLAFSLVASLLFKGSQSTIKLRVLVGGLAGYLSIAFYGIVASFIGLGSWAGTGFYERVSYALVNGTGVAVVGAILLPLGWIGGSYLHPQLLLFRETSPRLFYTSTATVSTLCWLIAGFTFAQGALP